MCLERDERNSSLNRPSIHSQPNSASWPDEEDKTSVKKDCSYFETRILKTKQITNKQKTKKYNNQPVVASIAMDGVFDLMVALVQVVVTMMCVLIWNRWLESMNDGRTIAEYK